MGTFTGNISMFVINVIIAVLILGAGIWAAKKLSALLKNRLQDRFEDGVIALLSNLVYWVIIGTTSIAALTQVGIEATIFIVAIAAVLLIIGLALQGVLTNITAGVLINILKPFKTGDYIEAGDNEGVVHNIQMLATELLTPDNRRIIVPNALLMQSTIVNQSSEETRRIDWVFHIGHEDDIDRVRMELKQILEANEKVRNDSEPLILVSGFADKKVSLTVQAWVDTSDYSEVFYTIFEQFKKRLDALGISLS